jgi:hypothetical protein
VCASFADAPLAAALTVRAVAALAALSIGFGSCPAHAADGESSSTVHAADDERPSTATGESEARVIELSDEGSALYERGEYRRALEKFIAAYALGQDPNLLFNMGRCYQQLGEVGVAEEKYSAFIADPGADPAGVERAKALLDTLHQPAPSTNEVEALAPVGTGSVAPARDAAPARAVSPLRAILPWATLGASVASLTAGTTLYLMGAADHGRITDSRGYDDPAGVSPLTERRARDLVSSGDSKKTLGAIGLGLGGALLATSVVLFVTGQDDAATARGETTGFGLALTPGQSGGALDLFGAF